MAVGHRHPHLARPRGRLEDRGGHRVQRLLQRAAVQRREPLQRGAPRVGEGTVPPAVRDGHGAVTPPRPHRRAQDPLLGLPQRRVGVDDEAGELRPRCLEHEQILDPRHHPLIVVPTHRGRGPQLGALGLKAVGVRRAVGLDRGPPRPRDVDARACDRGELRDEVPAEPQRKLLDLPHPAVPGEREDRVLLGVGRHHVGVVPGLVDLFQVAGEGDRHREVPQTVR
jgi:hypothetical protein